MGRLHEFQGLAGEPNPEHYNVHDDYEHDHGKWQASRTAGKKYRDPDVHRLMKHQKTEARLSDKERTEMYEAGRQAGKAEAKPKRAPASSSKKPHMGPQFRAPRKALSAQRMLNGMKRGVRKTTYKAPNLGVQVRGKRRSH